MKLAEFIREAISEIALGVHGAKGDVFDIVAVVPGSLNNAVVIEKSEIEFDIAVTVTSDTSKASSKSGKVGAGISVLGARIGTDGTIDADESSKVARALTSRLAFKVPVYFNAHMRDDPGAADEANYVRKKWESRCD